MVLGRALIGVYEGHEQGLGQSGPNDLQSDWQTIRSLTARKEDRGEPSEIASGHKSRVPPIGAVARLCDKRCGTRVAESEQDIVLLEDLAELR
jgi:hypothetical protein